MSKSREGNRLASNSDLKPIYVSFVPQSDQAYDTVGDYGETKDAIWFKITAFPEKPAYSVAVLLHEIHEFFRNKALGITVEAVDAFDYGHPELDDPGLSPDAPYHATHMEADAIERLAILFSREDWIEYDQAIKDLFKEEKK
jgi:hypothetical protein